MKYSNKCKTIFSSLFFRLISGFMAIIVIFIILQISVHQLYMKSIDQEITANNSLILNHSNEKLSQILSRVQDTLMILYMNDDFYSIKNKTEIDGFESYKVWKAISSNSFSSNSSSSFIKDIFAYREDFDTIISANGSYDKYLFLSSLSKSEKYSLDSWKNLSTQNFDFIYLPAFRPLNGFTKTRLMPIIFKPVINNKFNLMLVAMIDIDSIVKFIDATNNQDLNIYYKQELIYPEEPLKEINFSYVDNKSDYTKFGNYYLFKQFSSSNNISLIKLVSIKLLTKNLSKINALFIVFMIISILISIIASIIFSRKINNPIKNIIAYLLDKDKSKMAISNISELDYINQSIFSYILKTDSYERTASKNESLLKTFLSFVGLKNTNFIFNEITENFFNKDIFRVLSFQIHYKENNFYDIPDQKNATCFLLNNLQKLTEVYVEDCISFQVENNRIIFIINYNEDSLKLDDLIKNLLSKFENEKEYIYVTMCISNVFNSSSQLSQAVEETNSIFKWRKMISDTQLLTTADISTHEHSFSISNAKETSFISFFISGNSVACIDIIHDLMAYNYKNEVRLFYFQKLAFHIVNLCLKSFNNLNLDIPKSISIDSIYYRINECYTMEDFYGIYNDIINSFVGSIQKTKQSSSYIEDYIIEYIENHYMEDVYLDLLSDKLKISSSYLSQYFKSKTGMNFINYLNKIRIGKAQHLLLNTNKKIMDVANSVGFTNENSFSRTFKKYTNTTPKEFRRDAKMDPGL